MGVTEAVRVLLVLVALAAVPCVIAFFIMVADPVAERTGRTVARLRAQPGTAPIQHSVARLRELSGQLRRTPVDEAYLRADLTDAYDRSLRDACTAVGITHHINELTGLDLEIERLRLIEELAEAGLVVEPADHDSRDCR